MLSDFYASLDPIAFVIGPVVVRWYGLAYLAAFIIGAVIMGKVAKRWKIAIDSDDILTIIICVAFGVIIGARIGYVVFYGAGYYLQHPLEIFLLNQGGMSFHGGLIGAIVGGIAAARFTSIPILTIVDLGAIATPVGLFFGRCANFVNGELWGDITTLPWGVVFSDTGGGLLPRHPSQLYEAVLEGLVILIVLMVLARKVPARPRGTFMGVFLILYGIFRIMVEFVRVPDEQLGYLFADFVTMGQILSLPLIIVGIALLVYAHKKQLPQKGRVLAAAVDAGSLKGRS
ncbi:MAG: prolipoprotein diacylglyceryl transferase [Actinobacteria bacterium]|nr:prolipoprotein diacylglyceryl transferase [Actinomycetota bacterium]